MASLGSFDRAARRAGMTKAGAVGYAWAYRCGSLALEVLIIVFSMKSLGRISFDPVPPRAACRYF